MVADTEPSGVTARAVAGSNPATMQRLSSKASILFTIFPFMQ